MEHAVMSKAKASKPAAPDPKAILVIDVGGNNVKVALGHHDQPVKVPSGRDMTAQQMIDDVVQATRDWKYEAVSIGFRQQVNENSKELCWHHAIPEMNHNELVGWAGGKDDIAVVIFRHKEDHERSQIRMEINKEVFRRHTPHIHDVWSQGDTAFARQLYLINLGDWVSFYWAEKKGVDPTEIAVINMLKGKLAEVK